MTAPPKQVTCPICGRRVEWSERFPWRPFCSERCRLIDLGEWFGERRRISGEEPPGPADEDLEPDR